MFLTIHGNRSSRLSFLLLMSVVLVLCHSSAAFAKNKDAAPDWVKEAAAQKLPAFPAKTDAVLLLYDVELTVNPQGRTVEHVRQVTRVLRPQAGEGVPHGVGAAQPLCEAVFDACVEHRRGRP